MRTMKPLPKLLLALTFGSLAFWTIYTGTPKAISAVDALNPDRQTKAQTWSTRSNGDDALLAVRDGDSNIAEGMYRKVVLDDGITGFPAVDKALQFAWAHCGALLLLFGFLAFISIAGSNSEETITHVDGVHPQ